MTKRKTAVSGLRAYRGSIPLRPVDHDQKTLFGEIDPNVNVVNVPTKMHPTETSYIPGSSGALFVLHGVTVDDNVPAGERRKPFTWKCSCRYIRQNNCILSASHQIFRVVPETLPIEVFEVEFKYQLSHQRGVIIPVANTYRASPGDYIEFSYHPDELIVDLDKV